MSQAFLVSADASLAEELNARLIDVTLFPMADRASFEEACQVLDAELLFWDHRVGPPPQPSPFPMLLIGEASEAAPELPRLTRPLCPIALNSLIRLLLQESGPKIERVLAHDLNNQLTVLQGNLELFEDYPEIPEMMRKDMQDAVQEAIDTISRARGKAMPPAMDS